MNIELLIHVVLLLFAVLLLIDVLLRIHAVGCKLYQWWKDRKEIEGYEL